MSTMTTRQANRHREINNSLARTSAQREAAIAHLVKLETKLKDLQRARLRLDKALAKAPAPKPEPKPEPVKQEQAPWVPPLSREEIAEAKLRHHIGDDGDIPTFLDRRKLGEQKDAEAREQIERDNAERKRAQAAKRIEKLKIKQEIKHAKLTGELRKMPLTGRAALEKIRAG